MTSGSERLLLLENDSNFISQENKANSLKQIIRSLCTYRVVKLIHYCCVGLNEIIIGFKQYNLIRAIKNNSKQYGMGLGLGPNPNPTLGKMSTCYIFFILYSLE